MWAHKSRAIAIIARLRQAANYNIIQNIFSAAFVCHWWNAFCTISDLWRQYSHQLDGVQWSYRLLAWRDVNIHWMVFFVCFGWIFLFILLHAVAGNKNDCWIIRWKGRKNIFVPNNNDHHYLVVTLIHEKKTEIIREQKTDKNHQKEVHSMENFSFRPVCSTFLSMSF